MTKPKLNLTRPSAAKAHAAREAAKSIEQGESRLTVNIPTALHRGLKVHAVREGTTIRDFIVKVLEQAGVKQE